MKEMRINAVDDCDHGEMEVEVMDGVRIGACPDCGLFLELEDADVLGEGALGDAGREVAGQTPRLHANPQLHANP